MAAVVVTALVLVALPTREQRAERARNRGRPPVLNQSRRLAELGLVSMSMGLQVSRDDPSLLDRFDFPPFGRGNDRQAINVVRGTVADSEIVAFDYSLLLDGEEHRREYHVTVIPSRLIMSGRLRLSALPAGPTSPSDSFESRWRIDEEPPGELTLVDDAVRSLLLQRRFAASAVVVDETSMVLIDAGAGNVERLGDDVELLQRVSAAMQRAG